MSDFLRAAALTLVMSAACQVSLAQVATAITQAPSGKAANASTLDLSAQGVAEQEFFLQGQGKHYTEQGTWRTDGVWSVKVTKTAQPYATRVLVRHPTDPSRFNGTVIVEWLNVTGFIDAEIDGLFMAEEWLAKGYAWVGVSAQKAGLDGIKKAYPGRYDSLNIANDAVSYDIFTEVARLLREPASPLMGGLKVRKLLATGQSQSALRLGTYVNAIQPRENLYDAFLIHSRGSFMAGIDSFLGGPLTARIRTDLKTPVFQLFTEFDSSSALGKNARQPDTAYLRSWEVAGASHIDEYVLNVMNSALAGAAGLPALTCGKPFNNLPFYRVEKAVLRHLQAWMTQGKAPPSAPVITTLRNGSFERDDLGHALGGVRLPEMDAPLGVYGTSNTTKGSTSNSLVNLAGCSFVGSYTPLSSTQVQQRYASRSDFLNRYTQAAQKAVAAGYLLPEDAAQGINEAQKKALGLPLP